MEHSDDLVDSVPPGNGGYVGMDNDDRYDDMSEGDPRSDFIKSADGIEDNYMNEEDIIDDDNYSDDGQDMDDEDDDEIGDDHDDVGDDYESDDRYNQKHI